MQRAASCLLRCPAGMTRQILTFPVGNLTDFMLVTDVVKINERLWAQEESLAFCVLLVTRKLQLPPRIVQSFHNPDQYSRLRREFRSNRGASLVASYWL